MTAILRLSVYLHKDSFAGREILSVTSKWRRWDCLCSSILLPSTHQTSLCPAEFALLCVLPYFRGRNTGFSIMGKHASEHRTWLFFFFCSVWFHFKEVNYCMCITLRCSCLYTSFRPGPPGWYLLFPRPKACSQDCTDIIGCMGHFLFVCGGSNFLSFLSVCWLTTICSFCFNSLDQQKLRGAES